MTGPPRPSSRRRASATSHRSGGAERGEEPGEELEVDVARRPRHARDLAGDLGPAGERGRVPQREVLGDEHAPDQLRVADLAGQVQRLAEQRDPPVTVVVEGEVRGERRQDPRPARIVGSTRSSASSPSSTSCGLGAAGGHEEGAGPDAGDRGLGHEVGVAQPAPEPARLLDRGDVVGLAERPTGQTEPEPGPRRGRRVAASGGAGGSRGPPGTARRPTRRPAPRGPGGPRARGGDRPCPRRRRAASGGRARRDRRRAAPRSPRRPGGGRGRGGSRSCGRAAWSARSRGRRRTARRRPRCTSATRSDVLDDPEHLVSASGRRRRRAARDRR